jgi:RNA polymerase sigma-70 factor (sigma-E family)
VIVSFEEFASRQLRPLLGLAIAISSDVATAEDLVQDVLIKAHKHWDRIEGLDDPVAYVRRMLVNEHISWRRKWSRIVPRADLSDDYEVAADFSGGVVQRDLMSRLIADLPRQQQTVLALRYYAGLTDAEIAQTMHCSPGTIRGYASRALATLRRRTELNSDYHRTGDPR